MSGPVARNPIFLNTAEITVQYGEMRAYSCPRSFKRIIGFQRGAPAYYDFITGLKARGIHAETSKKEDRPGSNIVSRKLGAVSSNERVGRLSTLNSVHESASMVEGIHRNCGGRGSFNSRSSRPSGVEYPEPRPRVKSGKHNVFTHFQKDRDCEVFRRTKITRDLCRKRTGNSIPRAEKFVM